ncbi:MAG: cupin domain-containing protein [Anaerolineales bacterium]|nr:MAG: cupin domain-containing protein [Anaerolineales bacterium]
MQNLGKRLRALRKEQGLTLVQLGQQVGLSASYLSQIERSVTTPSLARLTAIASVLDVEVRYFFEDDVPSPCAVKSNQGKRLEGTADVIVELLSADPSDKKIQPYRLVCQPGASRDQPPTHPGEEFGFVLKGQLTVTVGEETFVLKAGDSIHYQTLQPYAWRNETDEECIAVWAVSPPISETEFEG